MIYKYLKNILPYPIYSFLKLIRKELIKLYIIYFREARFSNSEIDKKLKKYLNFKKGFYVELGANNGFFSSNTFHLQKKLNWTGLLIEPSQHLFFECLKNRGDKNIVLNNACVSENYKEKYVELIYSGAMTISKNLENDIENINEHASIGKNFLDDSIKPFEFCTVAKSLNQIFKENKISNKIDFLSLDVEGAEIEVLKGIDFDKYPIEKILVESRNFKKINSFLEKFGYKFVEKFSDHDYFFTKMN